MNALASYTWSQNDDSNGGKMMKILSQNCIVWVEKMWVELFYRGSQNILVSDSSEI